ncbi:CHAT domain-containing protein [Niabella beijingensis]|uniref:CHAT domain-containing protein n=1 Tax=Niabella beijingensis TaxID=2872700 RepID=UPI001CBFEF0A|nr:CHAT domain-containing tetratricopeptide repeat protein [Niabella beijingensis]MBZ4189516.1 CHAT domain-containing protein [Niabella beijingensis]
MAVLGIRRPRGGTLLRCLSGSLLLLLFFAAAPVSDTLEQTCRQLQHKDDLEACANFIFDQLDAHPELAVSRESFLKKALWRPPRTTAEKLACFNLLINTGWHLLTQRQIPASVNWYEQAYEFYEQHKRDPELSGEMDFEEFIAKPLGNNYTRLGDFSRAVFIQQRAIDEALAADRNTMIPGLYLNLATTYFRMRNDSAFRNTIAAGLRSTAPGDAAALPLYNLNTEFFIETGNRDSARIWNEYALQMGKKMPLTTTAVQTTLLARARILNLLKKHDEALICLKRIEKYTAADNVELRVETAIETGNTYLLKGRYDSAFAWHQKALQYFRLNKEGLYPDFKVTTALFGVATALLYKDPLAAANWYEKAVLNDYYTEQLLPASLNSTTAAYANRKYSETAIALYHQLFDQYEDQQYLLKALWLTELSKGRRLLNEQRRTALWQQESLLARNNKWVDQLRSLYVLLAETSEGAYKQQLQNNIRQLEFNLNLKERNALLTLPSYAAFEKWVQKEGRQKTLISYYLGDSYSYIIHIRNGVFQHRLDTATTAGRQELVRFIHTYFYTGPAAFNQDPKGYFSRSSALLHTWNPWCEAAPGTVLIAPDGELHNLPFEALSIEAGKPVYWGATAAIGYSFTFLQQAFSGMEQPSSRPVAVFSFEKPHLGFPALPQSAAEASFLNRRFATRWYAAEKTTDSSFMAALNSGSVIHLAAHAVAHNGGQPYLVLKNKLYLGQLQYITTRSPLVVLAACETGSGELRQGEGMQSLGRILLSKGVDGVLSSRWEVDDAASGALIRDFYQALSAGAAPVVALQQARVAYLGEHPTIAAQNPLYWAAYCYQGNNQLVLLRQKKTSALLLSLLFIAAAMAITALVLRYKKLL